MKVNKQEIELLEQLVNELERRAARTDFLKFARLVFPQLQLTDFHKTYYQILEKFAHKEIKNLIVTIPPQHGKSLGSSELLPAYLFGIDPDKKMALVSYNQTTAGKFNRMLQRRIDSNEYNNVFPETYLEGKRVQTSDSGYLRNTEEFEIVGKKGFFRSVGVGGALTSFTIDLLLMDDLYKDYQDATSPAISERVWDWYLTVGRTRLHNDSQQLIVFTRWDENDLVGRLEKQNKVIELDYNKPIKETIKNLNPDEFLKINFPALKTSEPTLLDKREIGTALWEEKHSKQKLEDLRAYDTDKFESLNQGNPVNQKGKMYGDFKTYRTLPDLKIIKAYCDTADTGKDYLCSIVYGVPVQGNELYLLDVVYTQEPMETTEPMVANQYEMLKVREALIESNNGGRSFARTIDSMTSNDVNVDWFHQSQNKQARILSNSASVTNTIVMPEGWKTKFNEFYLAITRYKKNANNKHDDAADCLTGVYESENQPNEGQVIFW